MKSCPKLKFQGYKELRAEKKEITVTDEEVQQTLDGLREQHATYTTVEGRPLGEGDFAQASLDGQPKDGEGKPVHMDEILIEIGGKNTVAEFTENLKGVSGGEERTFDVVYPADSNDKRLAGKTFSYNVRVQSVKQKTLPELNDDFAKELGAEFTTLDEVRKTRIREGMEAGAQARRRARIQRQAGRRTGEAQRTGSSRSLGGAPDRHPPGARLARPDAARHARRRHQENGF